MEIYDPAKIGKLLAWAGDHSVYRYGEDEVIKFSKLEFVLGRRLPHRLERDIAICREYLGEYLLETRAASSPDFRRTVLLQPYITGRYLVRDDIQNSFIRTQYEELMRGYRTIANKYAPIDLIGRGGVFRTCMSNIFVTPDERLKVVDATILDTRGTGLWRLLFNPTTALVLLRQDATIRAFGESGY